VLLAASPTPAPSPTASEPETAAETVGRLIAWPVKVILVIVAAVVLRWLICRVIDRTVFHLVDNALARRLATTSAAVGVSDDVEMAERLRQRARTVAGILKSITTLVIFGFAFVAILASIGVDVGPLILSAGVVGIAIGFGAQSLVKDFLTGVFMILEDQYAVGDFVDTGQATGTVEEVGLRLTRIRDDQGVIWYVPHGSIQRIGNRSQGFGLAVVDIPLAYGADVERAVNAIRAAVAELAADPAWAEDLLEDPPTVAVESMTATAVTLQVRQRTRPLRNLPVSRALRERVLPALDAAGIPRPASGGPGGGPMQPPAATEVSDPAAGTS